MLFTKVNYIAYAASLLHTNPQSSPQPHEAEGTRLAQQVKSRWTFGICPRFSQGLPQVALVVKNLPANAGGVRDMGSIPQLGRFSGGVHGNLLQYSCLENPMHKGAWQAAAHRVAKSWTWLKRLRTRTCVLGFLNCHFFGSATWKGDYLEIWCAWKHTLWVYLRVAWVTDICPSRPPDLPYHLI